MEEEQNLSWISWNHSTTKQFRGGYVASLYFIELIHK